VPGDAFGQTQGRLLLKQRKISEGEFENDSEELVWGTLDCLGWTPFVEEGLKLTYWES